MRQSFTIAAAAAVVTAFVVPSIAAAQTLGEREGARNARVDSCSAFGESCAPGTTAFVRDRTLVDPRFV